MNRELHYLELDTVISMDGEEIDRQHERLSSPLNREEVLQLSDATRRYWLKKALSDAFDGHPDFTRHALEDMLVYMSGLIIGLTTRADAHMLVEIIGPEAAAGLANFSLAVDKALNVLEEGETKDALRTAAGQ